MANPTIHALYAALASDRNANATSDDDARAKRVVPGLVPPSDTTSDSCWVSDRSHGCRSNLARYTMNGIRTERENCGEPCDDTERRWLPLWQW